MAALVCHLPIHSGIEHVGQRPQAPLEALYSGPSPLTGVGMLDLCLSAHLFRTVFFLCTARTPHQGHVKRYNLTASCAVVQVHMLEFSYSSLLS